MTGDFDSSKEFDIFKKYGIEYLPPTFVGILKPLGDTDFYIMTEVATKPEIRKQIDKVNINAINAPASTSVYADYKIKEYFLYKKSRKQLLKILKNENVKLYTWEEKEKYTNDYENQKLRELQKAQLNNYKK